eukprot:CAMPEP_0204573622 /NCGR_PEP_ID=MMETSP0661-20131031/40138_1 /ASSEMBLY_ACC=CAM_ASM_000606 /TAXON_ID=109239 /ORGANISM="Alexandrium margalefi, Strain AMGDE01CS-322" /LENGTH=65 /DNA_ID=CAMNT_0051582077 /DNA_START=93 /DNA_END=286 /DNA_ORIENTATION=-
MAIGRSTLCREGQGSAGPASAPAITKKALAATAFGRERPSLAASETPAAGSCETHHNASRAMATR